MRWILEILGIQFSSELEFEWDPEKEAINVDRHGLNFDIASSVFRDPMRIEYYDTGHSIYEDRYITIGMLAQLQRLGLVVYTVRDGESIRIISARIANRQEERLYYDRT